MFSVTHSTRWKVLNMFYLIKTFEHVQRCPVQPIILDGKLCACVMMLSVTHSTQLKVVNMFDDVQCNPFYSMESCEHVQRCAVQPVLLDGKL